MSLGVTYSAFLAGKSWLLAALEALIYYSLVHPRPGCGPCRPRHKAEPWQEQLPFTHFPSPGNIPRSRSTLPPPGHCGVEVSGGRVSAGPNVHQHREVACSYSPCARDGVLFPPQQMNLSLGKMQEVQGCSFFLLP